MSLVLWCLSAVQSMADKAFTAATSIREVFPEPVLSYLDTETPSWRYISSAARI